MRMHHLVAAGLGSCRLAGAESIWGMDRRAPTPVHVRN